MIAGILDPGLNRCGFAVFDDRRLVYASEPVTSDRGDPEAMGRTVRLIGSVLRVDAWVAELPQDYPGMRRREGTLEQLRRVILAMAGPDGRLTTYRPHRWKGNVPKLIHQRRVVASLDPDELAVVDALERDRDALDAVGLGLFHVGRHKRGGVPC